MPRHSTYLPGDVCSSGLPITEAAEMTARGARGQTLYISKKSDELFSKQKSACSQRTKFSCSRDR
jgi:hypothetical protein